MKAVIHIDVPEWQIGQEVSIYFPDTMQKKAICESDEHDPAIEGSLEEWKAGEEERFD